MFGVRGNRNFCFILKLINSFLELVESKFPWYLHMHKLMGTSPVIDRAAITHSQTPVDLGGLGCRGTDHTVRSYLFSSPLDI
jgi:hypothetical protein